MKKEYGSFDEFNRDLEIEYSFKDIAIAAGWIPEDYKGYMVKCPFHSNGRERTGSCQIGNKPGLLFFKCYGCGKKGSIYTFIQEKDEVSFVEAVHEVAELVGSDVTVNGYNFKKAKERHLLIEKEWSEFKLDYEKVAPKNPDVLKEGKRYFPLEVGYDRKENRIVLPFLNKKGVVLGFTKRRVNPNDNPKWIHSSQADSNIQECMNIFNLPNIGDKPILVEGPGDVASVMRAEINDVICSCGTSNVNEDVINFLVSKKVQGIRLFMDGDEAGRKALINWILNACSVNYRFATECTVIVCPEEKDPGVMSPSEIIKTINETEQNAIEYLLNNLTDEQILSIFKSREYNKAILFKKKLKEFIKESKKLSDNEVFAFLNNGNIDYTKKNEEVKDMYIEQLKVTAGIFDKKLIEKDIQPLDMTQEQARKILKMRYGI